MKPITRIDLEAVGASLVSVRQWREGWQDDGSTAPDMEELITGSIMFLLMDYEKQGYTCEMCDRAHGRALRGKTTRVDFVKKPDGWHLQKWPHGWTAKTLPITDEIKTEEQIEAAIAWCEGNGWTVHRINSDKARAWKGQPKPVHDRKTILRMRRIAEEERRDFFVDFAFDG